MAVVAGVFHVEHSGNASKNSLNRTSVPRGTFFGGAAFCRQSLNALPFHVKHVASPLEFC